MQLMTEELKRRLPPLYTNEKRPVDEAVVHGKFFDPTGRLTFYITEFDGEDTLFGYMVSPLGPDCDEWGYSSLAELQAVRGRLGLGIERDRYFQPCTFGELKAKGTV